MIENTQNENKKSFLSNIRMSDAAAIAIIPVVAQVIVFVYEYGYFGVFQIPITLISFKLNDLFIVIVAILSLGAIVYFYSDMLFSSIQTTKEPIRNKLLRSYGVFIFLIFLFFSYGLKLWRELLPAIVATIFIIVTEFVLPILQFKGKGTYLKKLEAHAEQRAKWEQNKDSKTPFDKLSQLIGPRIFLFVLALFGIYNIGRATAMNQLEFRVANTTPETIVLWMGDNKFIVAPFDRASKMIEPSFQVLLIGEDPTIKYRLQKMGPLSVDKNAIYSTQSTTAIPTISVEKTTPPPVSATIAIPTPSLVATKTITPSLNVKPSTSPVTISSPAP